MQISNATNISDAFEEDVADVKANSPGEETRIAGDNTEDEDDEVARPNELAEASHDKVIDDDNDDKNDADTSSANVDEGNIEFTSPIVSEDERTRQPITRKAVW